MHQKLYISANLLPNNVSETACTYMICDEYGLKYIYESLRLCKIVASMRKLLVHHSSKQCSSLGY